MDSRTSVRALVAADKLEGARQIRAGGLNSLADYVAQCSTCEFDFRQYVDDAAQRV
jgi:hypothetical protein